MKLPQLWRALQPSRLIDKLWLGLAAKIFPVGAAIPWFTDVAPDGFGIMKGQAFDVNTYVELAAVWPNGIIPDMRGCGVIGKEDDEVIGQWEEGQVKEHGHPGSSVTSTNLGSKTTNSAGAHAHTLNGMNKFVGDRNGDGNFDYGRSSSVHGDDGEYFSMPQAGAHTHSVSIGSHAHSAVIALFGSLKNTINHRKVNWIVRLA
ncbi:tail fiber protein [Vibrio galatheae]|uniref:Tail fiber protein n=1 Tax=Vibrio galatheae TaxID=579748 RepID=A0A0F4NKQ9_9VIBR|nr:tail fiber protein [Vibrio galatheae]